MSSSVIRFECIIPYVPIDTDPTNYANLQTFLTNLSGLMNVSPQALFTYTINNVIVATTYFTVFGYLTLAQSATALGYLNTLKAQLGTTYPINCVTWNATLQP